MYTYIDIANKDKKSKDIHRYQYCVHKSPFPSLVSNRLMAIELEACLFEKYGFGFCASATTSKAKQIVPLNLRENIIDVEVETAGYLMEEVNSNITKISFSFTMDLGGNVPGWISDFVANKEVDRVRKDSG